MKEWQGKKKVEELMPSVVALIEKNWKEKEVVNNTILIVSINYCFIENEEMIGFTSWSIPNTVNSELTILSYPMHAHIYCIYVCVDCGLA